MMMPASSYAVICWQRSWVGPPSAQPTIYRFAGKSSKSRKATEYSENLASCLIQMPVDTRRTIRRGKEMGLWLTLAPSSVLQNFRHNSSWTISF